MGADTKIEWAHHTLNPWIGCQKVGPGCDHCYAETLSKARLGVPWGPGTERRRTRPATWNQARKWDREAARLGIRYRVFCASLADVFDNAVDPTWRLDLASLIDATPNLDWLLLTKRIGNAGQMLFEMFGSVASNVWLGATIVNQAEADRDIPKLLATPAAKRFLSMEPLLGPVDVGRWTTDPARYLEYCDAVGGPDPKVQMLDWIIVGGESGPGARPMHPDWARSLRDQCAAAGVPFLFKQWGEWTPCEAEWGGGGASYLGFDGSSHDFMQPDHGHPAGNMPSGAAWRGLASMTRVGKKAAGRLLDGVQHDGVPA